MKLKCKDALVLISSFIDGELSGSECTTLEEHLKTCPRCQSELKVMRDISEMLKSSRPEMCPQEVLMPAIKEAIYRRSTTKEDNTSILCPLPLRRFLVGSAIAIVVVAGIFIFKQKDKNPALIISEEKTTYTTLTSYPSPSDDENFDDELLAIYYNNYAATEQDTLDTNI